MLCGPTCIRMISKYYGKELPLAYIAKLSGTNRDGSSLLGLSQCANSIGLNTEAVSICFEDLINAIHLPCIVHWNQVHYVVVYKIKNGIVHVADPAHGKIRMAVEDFKQFWIKDSDKGIALTMQPSDKFYRISEGSKSDLSGSRILINYIRTYRSAIFHLSFGLFVSSILQLLMPFLTQSIVDSGIVNNDINFIYLVLCAQLMVFFGRTTIDIIRNYVLMHLSSRINITLVSRFFVKLMQLPISFFDVKATGDIIQRIEDNRRIEYFLTGTSLSTIFSLFNFVIFSFVLLTYNFNIFFVFILGTFLYFIWILIFFNKRAELDYKRFQQNGQNQSSVIELINGMQEIKLNNAENQKRWSWERLQVKSYKINIEGLSLTTAQNAGGALINELKNIIIIFLTAKYVIDQKLSIGMMLSVSYIIGQLNVPVTDLVNFLRNWQDAKLSLERLSEIHNKENEEKDFHQNTQELNTNSSLILNNITFKYDGAGNINVLNDLSCTMPGKKITAIVGASGSGKTTLLKLLLKFYEPSSGCIYVGENKLSSISPALWRGTCGVVMQDGYIFSDTIAHNIAVGVTCIDQNKLELACKIANIEGFIDSLPLKYETKIGMEGSGISVGQKQRILIARAVYKDPQYLFFDEATSALDATNEKIIMTNLSKFFKNRTVVIIAHRLSTVKNADQIIVLDKGCIVEMGDHDGLTRRRKVYYELVKNQLELGN